MKPENYTVRRYMTALPHTIGKTQSLATARRMLQQYGIRHLPVMEMGMMVGILSDRELAVIESLPGVDPAVLKVEEAMVQGVFVTSPDAPLAEVAAEMADRKLGSAVVVESERVVGVLSAIDALRALADLLRQGV